MRLDAEALAAALLAGVPVFARSIVADEHGVLFTVSGVGPDSAPRRRLGSTSPAGRGVVYPRGER